jgi:hypothetical protein
MPAAYERVMLGGSDTCVEDALAVISGARPAFLPEFVLQAVASRLGAARAEPTPAIAFVPRAVSGAY